MPAPKAGTLVEGSRTGRPIMAILDLLGRRWALWILWELHRNSPASFRAIRGLCGEISPTALNSRLRELRGAGDIGLIHGRGYVITKQGMALQPIYFFEGLSIRESSPAIPPETNVTASPAMSMMREP